MNETFNVIDTPRTQQGMTACTESSNTSPTGIRAGLTDERQYDVARLSLRKLAGNDRHFFELTPKRYDNVKRDLSEGWTYMPWVDVTRGRPYLMDGRHRIVALMKLGARTCPCTMPRGPEVKLILDAFAPDDALMKYPIESDEAFLACSTTECWKCGRSTAVFCIYCATGIIEGTACEGFTVSNVTNANTVVRDALKPLQQKCRGALYFGYMYLAVYSHSGVWVGTV